MTEVAALACPLRRRLHERGGTARRTAGVAIVLGTLLSGAMPATSEELITTLSSDRVFITSKFGGAEIALFGSVQRDAATVARNANYDIVITARGPRGQVTVREKERFGPLWLNLDQRKFIAIPAFISVLSNRPIADISNVDMRQKMRIGIDPLVPAQPDRTLPDDPLEPMFRQALIRLRVAQHLFREESSAVHFLSPTLFTAPLRIPGTAPIGQYNVDVALFADGVQLTKASLGFQVTKEGIEHSIADLARDQSALYGAVTSGLAVLIGWLASVIFRRD
jgi:uncharacterized protein (TIGR02186 family)